MTLPDTTRRKVLVVGGGMAGLSVVAHISKKLRYPNVTLVEPSVHHDYPHLWPLIAVGMARPEEARRPLVDFLPEGIKWVRDEVTKVEQNDHLAVTASKQKLSFEYIVLCPELEQSYGKIKGIEEAQEAGQLCSVFSHEGAVEAAQQLQAFQQKRTGGTIVFAQPQGADEDGRSLQFAFLVDDMLRKAGKRDQCKLVYLTAAETIFPLEHCRDALLDIAKRKGIEIRTSLSLTKLHADQKQAEFGQVNEKGKVTKDTETLDYDLIHVAPLTEPPAMIAKNRKITSIRGEDKGKLKLGLETLQHESYPNVFGLGACVALPIPTSAAALRKQAEVVGYNVVCALQGKGPRLYKRYDGFTSLQLTTEQGKWLPIEMTYPSTPESEEAPSIPAPKETGGLFAWWKWRHLDPMMYWYNMRRGKA